MEQLKHLYEEYKSAFFAERDAKKALASKAEEIFMLRVGDVVEMQAYGKSYEAIVCKIVARVELQTWNADNVSIRIKAWTRKKTSKGWHKTENEHYSVSDRNLNCELKVVRHDDSFALAV